MRVFTLFFGIIFTIFISSSVIYAGERSPESYADWGKSLYKTHCASCHGKEGRGDGPKAAAQNLSLPDLYGPAFWGPDAKKRSLAAIADGYKTMPALDLTEDEARAVTDYMARAFNRSP
ncbi:MAG TPA: cytochrome c [Syntrophorhabdaceae bacterium]